MRKPDAIPPEAPNRSKTHRLFAAISRYRPRAPTVMVLFVLYTRHRHWDELPDRGVPDYLRQQMAFPFLSQ